MGPIEKKIIELSKTEGLSEETLMALTILKNQVKEEEKRIVNEAYYHGYTDKERNKGANWNHYDIKYNVFKFKLVSS